MAVLELEKQAQELEEEKVKMVQRMVQMEERLSEEVLCLNVGLSQTDTALRAVVHKLWDLDEVVARVLPSTKLCMGFASLFRSCQCVSARRESAAEERTSLQISCVPRPHHDLEQ